MSAEHDEWQIRALDTSDPIPARTWREIAAEGVLMLPNVVKLLVSLMGDRRVPIARRVAVGLVAGYVVSPIDLVPDFVIGVGKLDDIIIVSLALDYLMRGIDESIILEHWDGSIDGLDLIRSLFGWGAEILPDALRRFLPR
jgi:uncharacterized membrane protein YkvA (DUF1232 family)